MYFDTAIRNNLFVIDLDSDTKVIYAPLQGMAFFCGVEEAIEVSQFIANGKLPRSNRLIDYLGRIEETAFSIPKESQAIDTQNRLVIILSQLCNMACTYCFAKNDRSSLSLNETLVLRAIDYIFEQGVAVKVFTFIGGGEPFVTWPLLSSCIEHISAKSKETGNDYSIRIITNGSLINNDIAKFLSKYHISISLSFEVLSDIQDLQRPIQSRITSSYDAVCKGIDFLRQYHIPFGFRSTITNINVTRMPEMVKYCLDHFPDVKRLHFEPVTAEGIEQDYYHKYVKGFIDAFSIGVARDIFVTNSFINSYFKIKNRFCKGELCLTPTGDFVVCHRHSSENDNLFAKFTIGHIDRQSMSIDLSHIKSVSTIWNEKDKRCEKCIAKWHCAGKCSSIRESLSSEENLTHCDFITDLLSNFIVYNLKH